ncbi:MAG TPA: DNA-binding domain-containing protein [Thermoanaerobaculia bacterium]|nr:DNA-binding domain-containing protein [Thermoanaerobaculia bacterium]
MPPETLALANVQRWMQAVVVHPESALEGTRSPDAVRELAPEKVSDLVVPNDALTSLERVAIYQEMYLLRMAEALSSDYPILVRYLGDHAFSHLVADYVGAYPSRSYTLNRLGDHLPRFVETWGRKADRRFLAEIARLELALTESFDAPEETPPEIGDVGAVAAAGDPERIRLVASASLRLVRVRRSTLDTFDALRDGNEEGPAAAPKRGAVTAAFHRRDDEVRRIDLLDAAAGFLGSLASGLTLGEALAALPKSGVAADAVSRWLADWVSAGLFVRIEK